jgi:hypothetical protein
MSNWTVFAIALTTLLLITGSAFTLLEFYRADRKMKAAELRVRARRARRNG